MSVSQRIINSLIILVFSKRLPLCFHLFSTWRPTDYCNTSLPRYVPAYSTRVKFEDNAWHVLPANSSDPMGAADPVWTESYWNTIGLRVYAVQDSAYDWLILLAGLVITAASYCAVHFGRTYISKVVKHD